MWHADLGEFREISQSFSIYRSQKFKKISSKKRKFHYKNVHEMNKKIDQASTKWKENP